MCSSLKYNTGRCTLESYCTSEPTVVTYQSVIFEQNLDKLACCYFFIDQGIRPPIPHRKYHISPCFTHKKFNTTKKKLTLIFLNFFIKMS